MVTIWQRARKMALAGILSASVAQPALACAFHGYVPDPTVVDYLLGSEHVVLARVDPQDAGKYTAEKALIGPVDIDILVDVDPEITAKLAGREGEHVLLARDGAYGPWLQLAVLDDTYRGIVETVIDRQSTWLLGGDEDRFALFASLVNDPNPDIRRLAFLELDRADYALLSQISVPAIPTLLDKLEEGDRDLRPIRLLLAGLSDDQRFAPVITDGLAHAVVSNVPYLGAYATALIELQGAAGVEHIASTHLMNAALPLEARERLLEAMAIQNQIANRATASAISQAVSDMLAHSPDLAGATARQFGYRGDFSMAGPIMHARTTHQPQTLEDIFAISQYIGVANLPETDR